MYPDRDDLTENRRHDGTWWRAICAERRTTADTIEASLLPSMKDVKR